MSRSNSTIKAVVWEISGGTVILRCSRRNDLTANKSVCPKDIHMGEAVHVSFNYERNAVVAVLRELPEDDGIALQEEHFEDVPEELCPTVDADFEYCQY